MKSLGHEVKEDRMRVLQEAKKQGCTHNCPDCSAPTYCAIEAGKSGNLCWCMFVERSYTQDHGVCLCEKCLTT